MESPSFELISRIAVLQGDITQQAVDAVVNSANSSLLGGGGVDGAIHKAAGPELYEECKTLKGCATGEAKITKGYGLRAKWVIHAVGPIWRDGRRGEDEKLAKCYLNCLALTAAHSIRTIAFPAISTGAYGFPFERAARIALKEVRHFLEKDHRIEKVVFVCAGKKACEIYARTAEEVFS